MRIPFLSIIVPVFNAQHTVERLLDSLTSLVYPSDHLEIILVDNRSTDNTRLIIARYPVILEAEDNLGGSYAARNKGLRRARGEVIAFTDADCIADPRWVEFGVEVLEREKADLVAGNIQFVLSDPPRAAESFDALVHMNNERLVSLENTAVTANLFVRASVFRSVGLFAVRQSGADKAFTAAAVRSGCRLVYAPDAVVYHPARGLGEILRKSWRVGSGFWENQLDDGKALSQTLGPPFRALLPPTPGHLRRLIARRGSAAMIPLLPRIGIVAYLYAITWAFSAALSIMRSSKKTLGLKEDAVHPSGR